MHSENKKRILFLEDFEIEYIFNYEFANSQAKTTSLKLYFNCALKDEHYYGRTKFDFDKHLELYVARYLVIRLYSYIIKFTVKSLRDILKKNCIVKYDKSAKWIIND